MMGNSADELLLLRNFSQSAYKLTPGTGLAISGGVTIVLAIGFMAWDARQWRLGNIEAEQFKIR